VRRPAACLVVAALAALVVIVAGCGGGSEARLSKAEYEQRVAQIGQDLQVRFGNLSTAQIDPSDLGALADLLSTLGQALDAAAGELSDLRPPEDAQAAQDKLVKAARELADLVREVARKVKTAPLSELLQMQDELDVSKSDAFQRLQEAMDELKAKGYRLGDSESR